MKKITFIILTVLTLTICSVGLSRYGFATSKSFAFDQVGQKMCGCSFDAAAQEPSPDFLDIRVTVPQGQLPSSPLSEVKALEECKKVAADFIRFNGMRPSEVYADNCSVGLNNPQPLGIGPDEKSYYCSCSFHGRKLVSVPATEFCSSIESDSGFTDIVNHEPIRWSCSVASSSPYPYL